MVEDGVRGHVAIPGVKADPKDVVWVHDALRRLDAQGKLTGSTQDADDVVWRQQSDKKKYRKWKKKRRRQQKQQQQQRGDEGQGSPKTESRDSKTQQQVRRKRTQGKYTLNGKDFFTTRAKMMAWFSQTSKQQKADEQDRLARTQQAEIRRSVRARLLNNAMDHAQATESLSDDVWMDEIKLMSRRQLLELANELGGESKYCLALPGSLGVNALANRIIEYLSHDADSKSNHDSEPSQLTASAGRQRPDEHERETPMRISSGRQGIEGAESLVKNQDEMCFPFTDISSEFVRRHIKGAYLWQRILREAVIAERKAVLRIRIELQKLVVSHCKDRDSKMAPARAAFEKTLAEWDRKADVYRQRMGIEKGGDIGSALGPRPQFRAPEVDDGTGDSLQQRISSQEQTIRERPQIAVDVEEFYTAGLVLETVERLVADNTIAGPAVNGEATAMGSGAPRLCFVDLCCCSPGYTLATAILKPDYQKVVGVVSDKATEEVFRSVRKSFARNSKAGIVPNPGGGGRTATGSTCVFVLGGRSLESRAPCARGASVLLLRDWALGTEDVSALDGLPRHIAPQTLLIVLSKPSAASTGGALRHDASGQPNSADSPERSIALSHDHSNAESHPFTPSLDSNVVVADQSSGHSNAHVKATAVVQSSKLVNCLATKFAHAFRLVERCQWEVGGGSVTATFFEKREDHDDYEYTAVEETFDEALSDEVSWAIIFRGVKCP